MASPSIEYYDSVQKQYDNVRVVKWEKEFNYSAINNFGVRFANGEYILLLNIMNPIFMEEMIWEEEQKMIIQGE